MQIAVTARHKRSEMVFTELDVEPTNLRELLDKQQISQLRYRCCRVDAERGYTIWNDDAEADYGRIYRGSELLFFCRFA
jgi:hypothetical protein